MNLHNSDLLRMQCFIDGQWCGADDGATIEVKNPATGAIVGTVPKMGSAETRRAIAAAEQAGRRAIRRPVGFDGL
jgi:succinate-semialdehyde dehydrogenase/glutarate-semialdehyde dehydrogenase